MNLRLTPLAACACLAACDTGPTSVRPVADISGNWYLTDTAAPSLANNVRPQIGVAVVDHNGTITGNASFIMDNGQGCGAFALDVGMAGTLDASNHLTLHAGDSVVHFDLNATLNSGGGSFASAPYTVFGEEEIPQTASVLARSAQTACASLSGKSTGVHLTPITGSYTGPVSDANGNVVQVNMTVEQDTAPVASVTGPDIIAHGELGPFWVGGFPVTGTIQLSNSACGATHATIQANEGYVWGTYLQVEFDTSATRPYAGFGMFAFIDPSTGDLTVVGGGDYSASGDNNGDATNVCFVAVVSGKLTRN